MRFYQRYSWKQKLEFEFGWVDKLNRKKKIRFQNQIPEELLIDQVKIILSLFCNLPTTILEKLSQKLERPWKDTTVFFESLWIANGNT